MKRNGKTSIGSAVFALLIMVGAYGCRNVPIQAHGDQDAKPVIDCWFCETYPFWFDGWLGDSPQQVLDSASQNVVGGKVSPQGVYRVEFASNVFCDLLAVLTLGGLSPVHVQCTLQDDGVKNRLPRDITHERPKE